MFLRKFIILNKQGSKDIKAHVKLEVRGTKGRLSLSLEGARPIDATTYKLYAVTDEKLEYREILLGLVDVSKNGRGKLDISFNSNSVNESQVDISNLNVLFLKEENLENNIEEIVLGGYIHIDDDSISRVIKERKTHKKPRLKKQSEEKIEEISKVSKETKEVEDEEKGKEKAKEEVKEETKEPVQQEDKIEVEDEIEEIETEEIKETEKKEVKEETQKQKEEPNQKQTAKKEKDSDTSKDYSTQIINYTLDILKFFKEIKPFKREDKNHRWWQIDYNQVNSQRGFLPYYSYILNPPYSSNLKYRYVTCQNQIKKYNKYLFGVAQSRGKITHYIYGIPGRYEKSEHPYGGTTGFVTWLEDTSKTGNGYWLCYIDAYTGNVVRPL